MAFPYTAGEMEVLVLDNASDDGTVEMLHSEYPDVVVLAERVRRGFGANQNRAVAASHGDAVFILNPDATVHAHTIDRLVAALDDDGRTAVASGPIANVDETLRQDRPQPFPSPLTPYLGAIGLQRLRNRRPLGRAVIRNGWPSGAAFVVRREAFKGIGGFDESFFMYSEDVDLFRRLIDQGHCIAWVPDAVVTHPFPDEPSGVSARRETEIVNAEMRYMVKHIGNSRVYRVGIILEATVRLAVVSVPWLSRLMLSHGKNRASQQRALRSRIAAAVPGRRSPSLSDLAQEWNQQHAPPTPGAVTGQARSESKNATHDHTD